MRKIFSRSIAKLVTILSLTSLVQAAEFHLPLGTPGLQKRNMGGVFQAIYEQKQVNAVNVDCEKVKCVDIHDSRQDIELYLYFPTNGQQPTTEEAGEYSGARYNGQRKDDVTDWWVRVFGGDRAVELSHGRGVQVADTAIPMGFDNANNPIHIIQVNTTPIGTPTDFEQDFWQTFKIIAEDPVGRVLLYRLLIEIRRLDNAGINGICEHGIPNIVDRNDLRSVEIKHTNDGFSFDGDIEFDPNDTAINTMFFNQRTNEVYTTDDPQLDTLDIGLFHEMLHWYHSLRHLNRYNESASEEPADYRYLLRSYYGNLSELYTWGSIDDEELRTILGAPNYTDINQRVFINLGAFLNVLPINGIFVMPGQFLPIEGLFLNGDDLSENAYRLSKNQHGRICHMRFGHGANINACPLQNRFCLANLVAKTCYSDIMGIPINLIIWDIGNGATQ